MAGSLGVAPLAGAWIEIVLYGQRDLDIVSLPSRERGLKLVVYQLDRLSRDVAPLAGAWIEMPLGVEYLQSFAVAPLAGAWIEIFFPHVSLSSGMSLPSRERGLKYLQQRERAGNDGGRSPRGSVD